MPPGGHDLCPPLSPPWPNPRLVPLQAHVGVICSRGLQQLQQAPTGHWHGPRGGEQLGGCGQEAGCLPTCTLPLALMHSLSAPKTSVTQPLGSQGGRRSVAFHLWGVVSTAFPLTRAEGSRLHPAQCTLSGSHTCPRPVLSAGETDETRLSLCP